jgi:hypothetical protein
MRKRRRIVAAFLLVAALGAAVCHAQANSSIPRDEETEAETEDGDDEGEIAETSGGGAGGGGSQTPVQDHLLRELLHQQARFLLFSTTDLWRQGGFTYGGLLFAPSGLDRDGPVVKLIAGGGLYRYASGALGTDVIGYMSAASILPGYRFRRDRLTATVFLGADIQRHRLLPDDPSAGLRGSYVGARAGVDLWYQPTDWGMIAADASVSTIGGSYDARLAAGIRAFDLFYFGPEVKGFRAGGNYHQLRAGLHLTGLRLGDYDWTAGFGWATDSDNHNGAYGMLNFGIRR